MKHGSLKNSFLISIFIFLFCLNTLYQVKGQSNQNATIESKLKINISNIHPIFNDTTLLKSQICVFYVINHFDCSSCVVKIMEELNCISKIDSDSIRIFGLYYFNRIKEKELFIRQNNWIHPLEKLSEQNLKLLNIPAFTSIIIFESKSGKLLFSYNIEEISKAHPCNDLQKYINK